MFDIFKALILTSLIVGSILACDISVSEGTCDGVSLNCTTQVCDISTGQCCPSTKSAPARCRDRLNPSTGVSDCSRSAYLCNDTVYYDVMTYQCPKTCGRCNVFTRTGNAGCVDLLNPSTGVSDCPRLAYLCNDAVYYDVMTIQCPKTCGRCYNSPPRRRSTSTSTSVSTNTSTSTSSSTSTSTSTLATTTTTYVCDDGWTLFSRVLGQWCMKVFTGTVSQTDAEASCEASSAVLSGVEDAAELAYIVSESTSLITVLSDGTVQGCALWVGAARVEACQSTNENADGCVPWVNNAYEWTDGFTTGKTMMTWLTGQPDYADEAENCVQMTIVSPDTDTTSYGATSGVLNDQQCTTTTSIYSKLYVRGYVCGKKATVQ